MKLAGRHRGEHPEPGRRASVSRQDVARGMDREAVVLRLTCRICHEARGQVTVIRRAASRDVLESPPCDPAVHDAYYRRVEIAQAAAAARR